MNRLNGYDRHFRGRFLFLHKKLLSDQEYILWDLSYSCLADWDKSHGDLYGSFEYALWEIGMLLGWSASKVSRNDDKLYSLGLWKKRGDRIYVVNFDGRDRLAEIVKEKRIVDLQEQIAISQPEIAEPQRSVAVPQQQTPKRNGAVSPQSVAILQQPSIKASLVSFKGEFKSYKSEEDYKRIWEEMGCPLSFTIDDMKWIDRNVREHQ